jgi:hypothetical protein
MSHGHEHHYPDPIPSDGYEKLDAHPATVVKFLVWLVVGTALVLVAMWALLEGYKKMPLPHSESERHPLAEARQVPVAPQLEAMRGPHKDVDGHMISEEGGPYFNTKMWRYWKDKWSEDMSTYAWIDRQAHIVRVPIQRAMDLKLAKGFPTAPKPGN